MPTHLIANRFRRHSALAAVIGNLVLIASVAPLCRAADWNLQRSEVRDWNTLADWWSQLDGGGSHPASIDSSDHFFSNGCEVRTPSTSASTTFGGASLTLNGGSIAFRSTSSANPTIIGRLNSYGGRLYNLNHSGYVMQVVNITYFANYGATRIHPNGAKSPNNGISVSIGTLTGNGDLTLMGDSVAGLRFGVANADGFSGAIYTTGTGNISFETAFVSHGPLVVPAKANITLNAANITFDSLILDGSAKPQGSYSAASLGFGGSGSIKVVHHSPPAQPAVGVKPKAEGSDNATGRLPQMFGVNIAGMEFTSGTHVPTDADMAYYQSKGQTLIRLPFLWERVQPDLMGPLDGACLDQIKTVLGYAENRGMKVILDLHNYGKYKRNLIGSDAVPNAAYKDVWTKLATEFAGSNVIWAYDIMNEPNDSTQDWPAVAQYGVDGVRAADTTHFIMLEGKRYSEARTWAMYNGGLMKVTDPQKKIVFSAHCYFANSHNDHYRTYDAEEAYPDKGVEAVTPFVEWCKARKVYGHIGEYGVPPNDPRWNELLRKFLQYLDDNGISGTCWAGGAAWNSHYNLSLHPGSHYTVDKPQMSVLEEFGQGKARTAERSGHSEK